ncbi:Aste57867_17460 [Aphanomyces stellatus]|uniref:Pyruvate kinase n=1 Tax=Aphanomyces stellatus TaxID=120398 RepID=A0A485L9I3_9STRA|nr:hypothetical protein As57867_017400 [Aphanomyces stellatus]VFT94214.1 Aste57867_17460 [Aphanomyces stellatus]
MESVEEALKFLSKQFESAEVARVQWLEEKKIFQAQLQELQSQKKVQDDYAKELIMQVKMLEFALLQERGRYVASMPATVPKEKGGTRSERANTSPFNSPRGANGKEHTIFRKDSANNSFANSPNVVPGKHVPETEVTRTNGLEISRNDVSVTRSKEGDTLISRPRVASRADKPGVVPPPPTPAAPPVSRGPPAVEVTTNVNANFRACKMKLKLSGHLDGVRSICFHPTDPLLVSASEDCTVKIWNLATKNTEVEPMATLRLHTDSVLAVAAIKPEHSNGQGFRNGLIATGSKDGTIGLLAFPESNNGDKPLEPYAYDDYYKFLVHRLEAHRDAIWGLSAHPYTSILLSASADACVRVWGLAGEPTLKCTLGASVRQHPAGIGHNLDGLLVPTCVSAVPTNAATCIAGYTSCTIGQYDISSERLIQLMVPPESDVRITAFREAQVNQVVAHPTMPLVVAAHQDRRIRFYDLRAGQCVAAVVAHQEAVSSLALDPSGLYLASGGHDGSLRFWSVGERTCVHEQSAHRPKYSEAVHSVAYHASRGFVATGGADSVVKIYKLDISTNQILDREYTHHRQRKTKIICAIGPSCWSVEMLGKLLDAGMNVARFNFSHGDHTVHGTALANLRTAVDERPGCHCAVLLDTKGPEIRTGLLLDHVPIHLTAGQSLVITTDESVLGDTTRIACNYPHLPTSVSPGSKILCDDGGLQLQVVACRESEVVVKVLNTYVLEERKSLNLPGAAMHVPGITDKDKDDIINFAIPHNVDIVSGSFVRSAANVRAIRECLGEAGKAIRVHAKIESIEALQHLDEIVAEADGVHVSRGDLGMELNPEQVFLAQKLIIRKANIAGKPVVTSTQMLQSMTKCPTPTSAECSDVANAVLDGTDAVMLSAETAKGEFPVEAVATMARICIEAEGSLDYSRLFWKTREATPRPLGITEAVSSSAVETALDVQAKLIISLTDSGFSSLKLAKYRPRAHVLAVTASATVARQLAGLSRGVYTMRVSAMTSTDDLVIKAIDHAQAKGWIENGDTVVVLHGLSEHVRGVTSVVKIIQAHAHGFSSPMNQRLLAMAKPTHTAATGGRFTF